MVRQAVPPLFIAGILGACDFTDAVQSAPLPNALQQQVAWLGENAAPLVEIEPGSSDFTDLAPLREAIGDARVVLLGEPSHGDGTVFLMKARLIEFLHREMGFDVLAFESGIYDMDAAWRRIRNGESAATAVRSAVFAIWTGSREFQPTIAYIEEAARSDRPLELAGFDLQFTGTASRDDIVTDLETMLRRNSSALPDRPDWPAFRALLQGAASGAWYETLPPEFQRAQFDAVLDAVRTEVQPLADAGAEARADFWVQVLSSVADQVLNFVDLAENGGQPSRESGNRRDRRMGLNLAWLADAHFPGRKIIVWAATYHIVRDVERIRLLNNPSGFSYDGAITMGGVAAESLGADMYALGFTAGGGSAGSWFGLPVMLSYAAIPSLEWMLDAAGFENAFLDFRGARARGGNWLHSPVIARPLGYVDMTATWPNHLDGIIYNREMAPSTRN